MAVPQRACFSFHAGFQFALRDILHAFIDGERQGHAGLRGGIHVGIDARGA